MSIKKQQTFDERPNWIAENEFTAEDRLEWAQRIMAFSPRDWSMHDAGARTDDPELWALYLVINAEDADDAWESWRAYCESE